MDAKNYRDMTIEEVRAWGAAELDARVADFADQTPEGLRRAQEAAETRRKAIGASMSAAASMVLDAIRARRRARA